MNPDLPLEFTSKTLLSLFNLNLMLNLWDLDLKLYQFQLMKREPFLLKFPQLTLLIKLNLSPSSHSERSLVMTPSNPSEERTELKVRIPLITTTSLFQCWLREIQLKQLLLHQETHMPQMELHHLLQVLTKDSHMMTESSMINNDQSVAIWKVNLSIDFYLRTKKDLL